MIRECVGRARKALEKYPGRAILSIAIDPVTGAPNIQIDPRPNQPELIEAALARQDGGDADARFGRELSRLWSIYDHEECALCLITLGNASQLHVARKPWIAEPHDHCSCGVRAGTKPDHDRLHAERAFVGRVLGALAAHGLETERSIAMGIAGQLSQAFTANVPPVEDAALRLALLGAGVAASAPALKSDEDVRTAVEALGSVCSPDSLPRAAEAFHQAIMCGRGAPPDDPVLLLPCAAIAAFSLGPTAIAAAAAAGLPPRAPETPVFASREEALAFDDPEHALAHAGRSAADRYLAVQIPMYRRAVAGCPNAFLREEGRRGIEPILAAVLAPPPE
jgi:hypothetical protein